jgi:hypothetical protein
MSRREGSLRFLPTLLAASLALGGCGAPFPTADIGNVIRDRSASYLASTSSGYTVHGGYSSSCAHPGAHALFNAGTLEIYATLAGVVSRIDTCATAGDNDKYNIVLAVGMKGAVPVYFEYSLEPFGGKTCTSGSADAFASQILVKQGETVKQGQLIARFVAAGTGAHIHFNLKADGATICPEIFPASIFTSGTGPKTTGSCTETIADATFCHQLTASEDPGFLR